MHFPDFDQEFESDLFADDESSDLGFESSMFTGDDEGYEMQLAAELLGVSSEADLEQFLGSLISQGAGLAGSFLKSPAGQKLGGLLKSATKKVLPQVGQAIGGHFGGAAGARVGGKIATQAGRVLGLELEGLSGEDSEFEAARQFVRFARDASKRVGNSSGTAADARNAYIAAARQHAPGLVPSGVGGPLHDFPLSGRWIRRGRTITLM